MRAHAQSLIGWLALSAICGSALILAANRPVGWLFLGGVAFLLLILQMLLDLGGSGGGQRFRRLWPAVVLWLGVVVWALVQAGPAPVAGWAHPAWAEAGMVSGSISADPEASAHGALRLLSYAAFFWIATECGRDVDRALAMLRVMSLWSALLGLFGIVAVLTGVNPILGDARSNAVTASFVGPNAYALYAGLGLYCCLALILLELARRQDGSERVWRFARDLLEGLQAGTWIIWLGVAVLTGALLYSGSRAGAASVLAGLLVFIFCAQRTGKLRAILVAALAILMGIVMVGASTLIQDLAATGTEGGLRPEVYVRTLDAIGASPWLGFGLGSYQEAFRAFMTPEIASLEFDFAHNSYLENAFELGLPAAAALYLALLWIGVQIWRGVGRRRRYRTFPALGIAVLAAAGLHALVDFSLQMPATAGFAAWLLGLAWAQSFREPVRKEGRKRKEQRPQSA